MAKQSDLRDTLLRVLKSKLRLSDYYILILYEHWEIICGDKIGKKTRPKALNRNVLTISVENPALIFELGFIKGEFVKKINDFFSSENKGLPSDKRISIKNIRFVNE
ncbi:DUF721 domain-containing protein [Candidatus Acidulodesulfobacterium sp. H_13]|uniref:DUF721 domain-containing protein n=1 Tax=Candidatus Acidulodesulfobacterium sp. H_13 TaxID=3395470 RepID=UPI003AF65E64